MAEVNRIIIEGENAIGVEYTKKKKKLRALAPLIVVSAGGIGTTFILRETGIEEAGYNFFIDPLILVCGTLDDIKGGREVPMQAGVHMKNDRYIMMDHTLPKLMYFGFAANSGRIDRLLSHSHTLTIMVKAKDELSGKLIDRKKISKGLTERDEEALEAGYEKAKGILEHAGARKIFKIPVSGAHPGGTAKIGEIVDTNLKTQFENLYVCDASVIPDAFGLPPTLTLIGLGKRLAKYLTKRDNRSDP
jgi:choline dehydrogenase-like flavoprotein